jgi:hypothetical protein
MQLRRCFITIHWNHLNPKVYGVKNIDDMSPDGQEESWRFVFDKMVKRIGNAPGIDAAALALEVGEQFGRIHIQGYMEHKPKRLKTLATILGVMPTCFDIVKDAKGSWDYCSGINAHEGKFAFKRWSVGKPKLYGSLEKIVLSDLVNLYISGIDLHTIMKKHPYAYCVHRDRMKKFAEDWDYVK